jgi:hypothetical protein
VIVDATTRVFFRLLRCHTKRRLRNARADADGIARVKSKGFFKKIGIIVINLVSVNSFEHTVLVFVFKNFIKK